MSAVLVFIGLTFLAGLWRLKDAPLRLPVHFDAVRMLVKHRGIGFQEIYLFTPSLLSLPGILIEKGHFSNEQIQITADQIFIRWKLRDFFSPKKLWKIDIVHLEKPILTFKKKEPSSSDSFELFDIPVSSITLKGGRVVNLPNGTPLPSHKINGTFYQKRGEKTFHFYARTLEENNKTIVEGTASIDPLYGRGSLKVSNLCLKEWASFAPDNLHPWFNFFKHAIPEITVNFNGNTVNKEGTITATIHAPFLSQGTQNVVPITATIEGVETSSSYDMTLKLQTDSFPWEGLSDLWPSSLSPSAHHWCTTRLQRGTAAPITLHSKMSYEKNTQSFSFASLEGTLGVSDTTVHYMDDMPPVEQVTAEAVFSMNDFTIHTLKGTIKKLKVQPKSLVRFYDFATEKPQGLVDLYITGPLSDALWVADHPPLKFISPYGFKSQDVAGYSDNHLVLKFPIHITPTTKEITTTLESKIADFGMRMPLLHHVLQLDKGALKLQITPKKLSISGKSLLNGVPSSLYWEEHLIPNPKILREYKVTTTLPLEDFFLFTPPLVQEICQKRPELSFKGPSTIVLDYKEFPKNKSHLRLSIDLSKSVIDIPLFNYKKEPQNPGTLNLDLSFYKGQVEKINALKVTGPDLLLTSVASFEKSGTLQKFSFSELKVYQSSIQGSLEKKKNQSQWHLTLKGPAISLTPIVDFYQNLPDAPIDPSTPSTPFIITGDFSKVILQKEITLPALKARMEWTEKGLDSYGFLIKDKSNELLSLHYGPHKDKETVEFKTTILGQLLKGLDFTETISSGDVSFSLERLKKEDNRPFKGTISAENLRIKGAPILAKLLSLLSIEGVLSTLQGDGVLFIRGDADFEYLNKKIAVQHLELTSSSLGLTGKGYIDLKEKNLDAEGYIIPANILNQLIGNIPFIGRLLSGNSKAHKGLVSMSYRMKGPLKDPIVSSNPLSALAPNFVKGLFSHLTGSAHKKPTLEADKKA